MATLTETRQTGGFIVSEADGSRSRKAITVLSGQTLGAGEVCGAVKFALAAAPNPTVSGTGNGTMTLVRMNSQAQTGTYVVECTEAVTNGGVFSVTAPDGTALPDLTLTVGSGAATAYKSEHLDFTITDGSTDFAEGDTFSVVVTAGGTPVVKGTGNGTMSAISLGRDAQLGTYRVVCVTAATNGGTFRVETPDGAALQDFVLTAGSGTATAYTSRHVNMTITDGATDFAVGDYFHIVVANGSGKLVEFDPSTYDGRHIASHILYADVDASAADVAGVAVVRDAEVNWDELQWATGITTAEQALARTQLETAGIVGL